jgi:hypothetical protein
MESLKAINQSKDNLNKLNRMKRIRWIAIELSKLDVQVHTLGN